MNYVIYFSLFVFFIIFFIIANYFVIPFLKNWKSENENLIEESEKNIYFLSREMEELNKNFEKVNKEYEFHKENFLKIVNEEQEKLEKVKKEIREIKELEVKYEMLNLESELKKQLKEHFLIVLEDYIKNFIKEKIEEEDYFFNEEN